MRRLIVSNSALAYLPPPASLVGPGDVVLPLVDRFEEALFMPSPLYEELYDEIPELNQRARALSRKLGDLLPDAVARPRPEWGHSAWEVFADSFVKFSLGPLMVNSLVAERASAARPEQVLGWEEPADPSWWSGRQMVAEIASDIARAAGARLRLRSGAVRRASGRVTRLPMTGAQGHLYFLERLRRPPGTVKGHYDVVFAIVSPTLTPIFDRVAGRLAEEHDLRVLGVEVPLGPSMSRLITGELPHTSLYAYSTAGTIAAANLEVLSSWAWQRDFASRLARSEELSQLAPGARSVLIRRIRSALIRDLPIALYHSRLWRRLLDAVQPAAVVCFNAYGATIAPAIHQARAGGITTLACQHGIWGPLLLASSLLPYDDVLVFGDYARELLGRIADPSTRFAIAGHSLYDYRRSAPQPSPRRAGKPIVLATTQPIEHRLRPNEDGWWLDSLADGCAELGADLVIKPHPEESNTEVYWRLVRRHPDSVTVTAHGQRPLEELMAECDVLVTRFSTTAMEANLLGKPVLTVNPGGGRDQYPYAQEGGALGAYSRDEILPALRALLTDEETRERLATSRQQFIERHVGPVDGRATERIAAIIARRAAAARGSR